MSGPTKVTRRDALAIGLVGVLLRVGGQFTPLLLEFLGAAAGVWCLLAVAASRPFSAAFAATTAWSFWWLGRRLERALAAQPLDQMKR